MLISFIPLADEQDSVKPKIILEKLTYREESCAGNVCEDSYC